MQVMKAREITSGRFVLLPTRAGREFQGPVWVEENPDVPGNVLIQYPGGTYETDERKELRVLARPRVSGLRAVDPRSTLIKCSDAMVRAGWPQSAREQFLEQAKDGNLELLLGDVFEVTP
jgi:hypothetical protein